MKYLLIFIIVFSMLGCDSQSPETLITEFKQSIETKNLSKLESLYLDEHYKCSLDQVNFPEKLHELNFEVSSMTTEAIENYKMAYRSEVTKNIKFAEYLQKGLSYKDAGKETYKYLSTETNSRQGLNFKMIPSHEANITLKFTSKSDDKICPQKGTKRMTLYFAKNEGQYKIINPMCDVKLATKDTAKIVESIEAKYTQHIDLALLTERYIAEGLKGIKAYSKETNIPEPLVLDSYLTNICPRLFANY
ncbi:hypothetical protein [Kangiella sp.]|uniref:hypothetical protein n=1 Tax=Kangiella sp. TaxID=1920245 RepID=UPI001994E288|nr:hypothetical protein [Kangiella sp.]MBD3654059.1 hypothetical protein [Kangiella sp.]